MRNTQRKTLNRALTPYWTHWCKSSISDMKERRKPWVNSLCHYSFTHFYPCLFPNSKSCVKHLVQLHVVVKTFRTVPGSDLLHVWGGLDTLHLPLWILLLPVGEYRVSVSQNGGKPQFLWHGPVWHSQGTRQHLPRHTQTDRQTDSTDKNRQEQTRTLVSKLDGINWKRCTFHLLTMDRGIKKYFIPRFRSVCSMTVKSMDSMRHACPLHGN